VNELPRRYKDQLTFSIGGELQNKHVCRQPSIREIFENLLLGYSGGQLFEDVVNSNTDPTDARLSASLVRFNCDDVLITHLRKVYKVLTPGNQ
jgi:hypothetical protein